MSSEATILVADDDRAIRTVLTQALARLGYDVRTTGHAATLWRWVADGEGDLVITDVVMPRMDGPTLIGIESLLALKQTAMLARLRDGDVEAIFSGNARGLLGVKRGNVVKETK